MYASASLTPTHPTSQPPRALHPLHPAQPFIPRRTDPPIRLLEPQPYSAIYDTLRGTQTKRRRRILWSGRSGGLPWRRDTTTRYLRSPPPLLLTLILAATSTSGLGLTLFFTSTLPLTLLCSASPHPQHHPHLRLAADRGSDPREPLPTPQPCL